MSDESKPTVAAKSPIAVDVEAGKDYYWCSCGKSKNQPFCDGSHVGTKFTPMKFTPTESKTVYFCRCKNTKNPPFCDGSHNDLSEENENTQVVVAAKTPFAVDVEEGKDYYWCSCGKSKNQPFCDGSHKGTGLSPMKYTATETKKVYFCGCKHTKNKPMCDGSHTKLPKGVDIEDIGGPARKVAVKTQSVSSDIATEEEPTLPLIKALARNGISSHHGEMAAMGVPRNELPRWEDIQILVAQLASKPLSDDIDVDSTLVIGPRAKKPLKLSMPIFVSDMSFGALSFEAKVALARGAEMAGTGICSGEGGMLEEERAENSHYFYELASAKFGYNEESLKKVQAFHFKGGQGAKTGTGGHLPGNKVTEKIASVRHLEPGQDAISPPTFTDLRTPQDFKNFANHVREITGGIPIGFKLSANHIEEDIEFALKASADYLILDGRGGGTGAAPLIFRNNISVPTIPALARARHYLDSKGVKDVTLVVTGGLRTPDDFIKAMCLGADGIAIANSAIQSIGCIAARMCHTNQCPAGIATQDPSLTKLLDVEKGAKQLCNFLQGSNHLMKAMARACGHDSLSKFNQRDITTWKKDMADLTGIQYAGVPKKKRHLFHH